MGLLTKEGFWIKKEISRHKLIIILIILLLNLGCSEQKFTNTSNCEDINNEPKRDKCFANLILTIPSDSIDLRADICSKITDTEMRDLCFFKVIREGLNVIPPENITDLNALCQNIESETLREYIDKMTKRPHLEKIL